MFDFTFISWNLIYIFFDKAKKTNTHVWNEIVETTFINDIGNWDDFLKLVLIDEKCGNLRVVIDAEERSRQDN